VIINLKGCLIGVSNHHLIPYREDNQKIEKSVKDAIKAIMPILEPFTDWHKDHILECVKEELTDIKSGCSLEAT